MWKKILSLLLGAKNPKPAYALVPKQGANKMPQRPRN